MSDNGTTGELLAFQPAGFEHIPGSTLLTRLNYFDGKFLRAEALRTEQEYFRRLAALGARAGGPGVVYGFDVSASGERLMIGGGLAFAGNGNVLYSPDSFDVGLQELVDATRRATVAQASTAAGSSAFELCLDDTTDTTATPSPGRELYVISIAHAQDACGEDEVFGKLCDDGCATSADREYLVEGVIVRATPWQPRTPLASSKAVVLSERHLRSQLASAAFADERSTVPSQISRAGLLRGFWCTGAAATTGWELPIAIVGRLASGLFVDEWIVRRELIETPPRGFWAWAMSMRPWASYLAQILQFQCQLPSVLDGGGDGGGGSDPCAPHYAVLGEAVKYVQEIQDAITPQEKDAAGFLNQVGGITRLRDIQRKLVQVVTLQKLVSSQVLVDGGIVELPPAGYLPVTPGATPPVEEQVRRLLGDGVDLRFCATTADYVPHALEEAQHMDRISLIQGLDDPTAKPKVDVYVPDGQVIQPKPVDLLYFDTVFAMLPLGLGVAAGAARSALSTNAVAGGAAVLHGAGRADLSQDGCTFYFAGAAEPSPQLQARQMVDFVANRADFSAKDTASTIDALSTSGTVAREAFTQKGLNQLTMISRGSTGLTTTATTLAAWAELGLGDNPFSLTQGATTTVSLDVVANAHPAGREATISIQGTGTLTVDDAATTGTKQVLQCTVQLDGSEHAEIGTNSIDRPFSQTLQAVLTLQPGAAPQLEIRVGKKDGGAGILIEAGWTAGSPRTITIRAGVGTGESVTDLSGVQLAVARLRENPAIQYGTNTTHRVAETAIGLVADGLDDPTFSLEARQKLFPPTGVAARSILATRDWVLFQRRRTADCGAAPAEAPVTQATRAYKVFLIRTENVEQAVAALQGDQGAILKRLEIRQVGDVEFAGGTGTLASDPADVLADWRAASPGPGIAYAGLATDESDESDALLRARLNSYDSAVGAVSKPTTDLQIDLLPQLASLPSGNDGQLVFVTTTPTFRYHVLGFQGTDQDADKQFDDLANTKDIGAFLGAVTTTDLGTIDFAGGSDTVVTSALTAPGGTRVDGGLTLLQQQVTEPTDDQGKKILDELNVMVAGQIETAVVAQGGWQDDAPAVTILKLGTT